MCVCGGGGGVEGGLGRGLAERMCGKFVCPISLQNALGDIKVIRHFFFYCMCFGNSHRNINGIQHTGVDLPIQRSGALLAHRRNA